MKWNLFSFGQTKYQYESKQKEYLASRSNFEYEKNKADVDLQLALKSYNIAKAKIKSTEATLKALKIGKPEILNTDQGVQYTSNDFIELLETNNIKISMDSKGRALDNVWIERFWRIL